ncbi:MAG: NUDIX hydrolase [Henriciella sp.]|nr:NUDIX hydrolase [Henriciella sp.]
MTRLVGSAFDKEDDGDVIVTNRPSPRPKDASTIILVRRDQAQPRVLMGKRSGRHDFMPDKYVFPGGRVDRQDGRVAAFNELRHVDDNRLRFQTRRSPRAFALTAIRETFEETGLLIGRSAEMPKKAPEGWQALYDMDIAPSLKDLRFVGRAITPPYRPKRFDARFFMADAERALIDERPPIDGAELHDLQWVTLDDASALDLPSVTRFMLDEIRKRLSSKTDPGPPFLRWTRRGHSADRI